MEWMFCISANTEFVLFCRCENIASEETCPKKFVCSQCEEMVKKEGETPPKKLQSTTFSATKQALDSGRSQLL